MTITMLWANSGQLGEIVTPDIQYICHTYMLEKHIEFGSWRNLVEVHKIVQERKKEPRSMAGLQVAFSHFYVTVLVVHRMERCTGVGDVVYSTIIIAQSSDRTHSVQRTNGLGCIWCRIGLIRMIKANRRSITILEFKCELKRLEDFDLDMV